MMAHIATRNRGFTLIELLVSLSILVIVTAAIYEGYQRTFKVARLSKIKTVATSIANEEFEIVRNMAYSDVGLSGGSPAGALQRFKTVTKGNFNFFATTTIRNVDDPFDGTIGSTTRNDISPADYKLVQVDLRCVGCNPGDALSFSTIIAPKGLESTSNKGSLFVRVFDANGQAVEGATVSVVNGSVTPSINISESTDTSGILQLVDIPTSTERYRIVVSKGGYSSDQTYWPGATGNPNPIKRHASVIKGSLTQTSFAIDQTSSLDISTLSASSCSPMGNISMNIKGSKLIGTPNVYKYNSTTTSNSSGLLPLSNLEWDTYAITLASAGRNIAGSIPLLPIAVNPGSENDATLMIASAVPNALLVSVRDSGSGLPLSGATVEISRSGTTYSSVTGQGYIDQTNWSGGSGQDTIGNDTRYFSSDGNIETASPAGQISLKSILGAYVASGELTSSIFDVGTSSDFYSLAWLPANQPAQAGSNAARFQLAASNTNSATTTWNYVGPDGTSGTYYTASGQTVHSSMNGKRYIRYKVFLQTANSSFTPTISDVSITFGGQCIAPGQVYFDGLTSGIYSISVTKTGYETYSGTLSATSSYSTHAVSLGQ
jgi:prepilin-type N-terminal cleavage/methylation domain-containing protein